MKRNIYLSPYLALVLIALAVFVAYSNIYECPFVFDDKGKIVDRESLRDLDIHLSIEQLMKPRGIVDLTFALNYHFGRLNVFGYHLINVLIHLVNGFLVYFLARIIFARLCRTPRASGIPLNRMKEPTEQGANPQFSNESVTLMSLFAALIFVAHPVQTQAVTFTVQRYTSMATMFYLASVFFYLKGRMTQQGGPGEREGARDNESAPDREYAGTKVEWKKGKSKDPGLGGGSVWVMGYFVLSLVCGIFALWSKQNTASLPLAIILVEYMLIDNTWRGWRRKLPWLLPAFALFVVLILFVSGAFRGGFQFGRLLEDVFDVFQETQVVGRWSYLCTQFNVVVIYIRLLFLPVGQSLDYMYPFKSGLFDGYTPLAFLLLCCITAAGIWNVKKRPVISLAVFWFLITLSVESGIIPIRDAVFEHRLYLPMFGFALFVPYAVFRLLWSRENQAILVSIAVILSLGTATYLRNRVWRDGVTLWSDVVSKNPEGFRGHNNLGFALEQKGRIDEAISHYSKALQLNPYYPDAHNNLGNAFWRKRKPDEAINHFSSALELRPGYAEAHNNMGNALASQGRLKEAVTHFTESLRLKPKVAEVHNNLGIALYRLGRLDEAIHHYHRALRIRPGLAEAHNSLGVALARQGRLKEAVSHFSEALRINPGYGEARRNLERASRALKKPLGPRRSGSR